MSEELYRKLGDTMARRSIWGPPADIPEYYEMLKVLFTPEQAEIQNAMPVNAPFTPDVIAKETGKSEEEVTEILEDMADKGLCMSFLRKKRLYFGPALLPGIFEYQFMRGTKTDRDREIARALHRYRNASLNTTAVPPRAPYPATRVIPVDRTIQAGAAVQTYDQVMDYIENSDTIAVTTCYCRHEALLVDENDVCGMPMDVCIQFRTTAEYLIERGIGRRINKEEAREIMLQAAKAGLVHAGVNTQRLEFICNCCACHCGLLQNGLRHSRPAEAILHSFEPSFDGDKCTLCGICVDRCPSEALVLEDELEWKADRCIGCGVCVWGCEDEAITMVERPGDFVPPLTRRELGEKIAGSFQKKDSDK